MIDVAKRARLQQSLRSTPGPLADAAHAARAAAERAATGLWRRDPATWSSDAETQKKVANRLGWLSSPQLMADSVERLEQFAAAVRRDGITDVVLLGMGGSSLAPEVLRAVLGVAPGFPAFHMLDSTDPAAVRAIDTPPARTLYLLASKSGSTIEPNVLAAHFRERLIKAGVSEWGRHFVAITDDNTDLSRRAQAEKFRDVFVNPSDIGGRYSAVSFFGMVPAALMGIDIRALTSWALAMLETATTTSASTENPAVGLGLAIGSAARAGRDKLTLLLPRVLGSFGLWVEQLIAESTGKHGVGIVPIAGEPLANASAYGADRIFVRVHVEGITDDVHDAPLGNAPIVDIEMPDLLALGAEFVRWEIATAIAGALLEINPFDEPNVQQAKDATRKLLDGYKASHQLPAPQPDATLDGGVALTLSSAARTALAGRPPSSLLSLIRNGDYVAVLAYAGPDSGLARAFADFRRAARDRTHAATMFGYGPRYLHSTGQLHKGGANTGVFILFSATPREDLPIPGEAFSFGTLELAQAIGDFQSLDATGRRALHVHLPAPDPALVQRVAQALLGSE